MPETRPRSIAAGPPTARAVTSSKLTVRLSLAAMPTAGHVSANGVTPAASTSITNSRTPSPAVAVTRARDSRPAPEHHGRCPVSRHRSPSRVAVTEAGRPPRRPTARGATRDRSSRRVRRGSPGRRRAPPPTGPASGRHGRVRRSAETVHPSVRRRVTAGREARRARPTGTPSPDPHLQGSASDPRHPGRSPGAHRMVPAPAPPVAERLRAAERHRAPPYGRPAAHAGRRRKMPFLPGVGETWPGPHRRACHLCTSSGRVSSDRTRPSLAPMAQTPPTPARTCHRRRRGYP